MSGPVTTADVASDRALPETRQGATLELTPSSESQVGELRVRRALPRRARRTVGPWCFVDHMGPATLTAERGLGVAPHPHIGLQTVTWLLAGEALHRDSLGTEQVITPGQLNLMTAGYGVAHSEEGTGGYRGQVHGVQLWVAQPSTTRNGAPAFEHHPALPVIDVDNAAITVLIGDFAGGTSPARRDTEHAGLDLALRAGDTAVPLNPAFEYALVIFSGAIEIDAVPVGPGALAYLGLGRDECTLSTREPARALLIGGVPLEDPPLMWWNFVARTREEIIDAHRAWMRRGERFGDVASSLPRVEVSPPPWRRG